MSVKKTKTAETLSHQFSLVYTKEKLLGHVSHGSKPKTPHFFFLFIKLFAYLIIQLNFGNLQ